MSTPMNLKLATAGEITQKPLKFDKKQLKLLPDNYYSYDIHRHLKTDLHNLSPKKGAIIYVCPFMVVESKPNKIIDKPFLQYLLYKYTKSKKKVSDLCIFPFEKYKTGDILDIGKKIIKTIFNTIYTPLGYIKNKDGIFLFYQIDFLGIIVRERPLRDKPHFVWATISEICNTRKYITFPIHDTVSNLFYSNPKLIYLKDKNKQCIEVPTIGYIGAPEELLNYIATFSIKASTLRTFGPYYYFSDFNQAVRRGGWSSNYEKRIVFDNAITDDNGKYNKGGLIRFVLFLGNNRVVLDRKTDPLLPYVKKIDKTTPMTKEDIDFIKKGKGKWTKTYNSLLISNFKNNNRSGYFWPGTGYILKNFNAFTSLSIHLLDKTTLKTNWDMDYEFYNIK